MKKYLFLLAFILPFMAMGQNFQQEIDSITRHHHRAKGDFSLHRHEMDEIDTLPGYVLRCPRDDSEWQTDLVPEHMPIIDGNKNGVIAGGGAGFTSSSNFTYKYTTLMNAEKAKQLADRANATDSIIAGITIEIGRAAGEGKYSITQIGLTQKVINELKSLGFMVTQAKHDPHRYCIAWDHADSLITK